MKYLAYFLLSCMAWGQTTTTSGPVTTARIASCDELVGIGGRVYTLRQLGYCSPTGLPKPEPMDVPAIRPTHEIEYEVFDSDSPTCKEYPSATARWATNIYLQAGRISTVDLCRQNSHPATRRAESAEILVSQSRGVEGLRDGSHELPEHNDSLSRLQLAGLLCFPAAHE